MKKQTIVAAALALGVFSVGAVSAFAANSCCGDGKCASEQSVKGFKNEVAGAAEILNAKEIELRELYARDGFDTSRAAELDYEITGLKKKISSVKAKYGISPCCLS